MIMKIIVVFGFIIKKFLKNLLKQIGGHLKKSQQILDITMELQKDHQSVIMH